ncbi:MAG: hypothetical protein CM15mV135_160 [uncultured marine virus]|nr:MAG: hypothetical protein CM15mV135_160 [uncultured marine virus]
MSRNFLTAKLRPGTCLNVSSKPLIPVLANRKNGLSRAVSQTIHQASYRNLEYLLSELFFLGVLQHLIAYTAVVRVKDLSKLTFLNFFISSGVIC